jgi:ribosome-binding protein aMBF1 (putative translation factor)
LKPAQAGLVIITLSILNVDKKCKKFQRKTKKNTTFLTTTSAKKALRTCI